MTFLAKAARLAAASSLLALAACSSGGGTSSGGSSSGGSSSGGSSSGGSSSGGSSSGGGTPNVSIGAPDPIQVNSVGPPPFNFTTNLPPVGTVFSLSGPAVQLSTTMVGPAGIGSSATATFKGNNTSNGTTFPVVDLSIPALGVSVSNLRADGTPTNLSSTTQVGIAITTLNYTSLGAWSYGNAANATGDLGIAINGSGTPLANIPKTGTANYTGSGANGGVGGFYFVPSGTGTVSPGTLTGTANLTANFSTGAVSGSFTNMTATPSTGGATTPWNNVNLTGTISSTTYSGTASVAAAPAGAGIAGFSTAATGAFVGTFFGPNADETGGTFSITEPGAAGGGKTAFGAFGAHQ